MQNRQDRQDFQINADRDAHRAFFDEEQDQDKKTKNNIMVVVQSAGLVLLGGAILGTIGGTAEYYKHIVELANHLNVTQYLADCVADLTAKNATAVSGEVIKFCTDQLGSAIQDERVQEAFIGAAISAVAGGVVGGVVAAGVQAKQRIKNKFYTLFARAENEGEGAPLVQAPVHSADATAKHI